MSIEYRVSRREMRFNKKKKICRALTMHNLTHALYSRYTGNGKG